MHAHLKFDELFGTNAVDSTGNSWTGTLVNGPVRVPGISGNAIDLDGTNDYVRLPTGVVSDLTRTTIATWVQLDVVNNWSQIFDFGSSTAVNMFLAPQSGITSLPVFAITTSGSGGEQRINSSVAIAPNVWTHVAVTIGGGTGVLYIDGVEVGRNNSMTLTPSSLGATTQNYIGRSQYQDPYLNGRVDDFRVYDDILSAADIAALATLPASAASVSLAAVNDVSHVTALSSSDTIATVNNKGPFISDGPSTIFADSQTSAVQDEGGKAGQLVNFHFPALRLGQVVDPSGTKFVPSKTSRLWYRSINHDSAIGQQFAAPRASGNLSAGGIATSRWHAVDEAVSELDREPGRRFMSLNNELLNELIGRSGFAGSRPLGKVLR